MIAAKGLTKNFGKTAAVSSLDFNINKGEIFGIVGPDGAGKSTLLRLMSTILIPDKGNITFRGTDIYDDPFLIKERLAYMPQRFGLYEELTVEENIFFFGRIFGISKKDIKRKLSKLYGFSNLGPFKDRLAGKLSGGMKQKLGLACCLVHTPELILLDEPTNGVDPVSRREFWKILYDLLGEGVTIIISTAYLDEAERCNRIALIYNGKFIRLGDPKSVRASVSKKLLELIVDKPREGEVLLSERNEFSGIIRSGNSLKVFTEDIKKTRDQISKILGKRGIEIKSMKAIVPSLEDSFMEIVSMEGLQ